jgi:hypothetical protein
MHRLKLLAALVPFWFSCTPAHSACDPITSGGLRGCRCYTVHDLTAYDPLKKCDPQSEAARVGGVASDYVCCMPSGSAPQCTCENKIDRRFDTCLPGDTQVSDCNAAQDAL